MTGCCEFDDELPAFVKRRQFQLQKFSDDGCDVLQFNTV
jgi:hypothetical protein